MITKKMALEKFVQRIMENKPLAKMGNQCYYDPRYNGGCAIGCLLDLETYDRYVAGHEPYNITVDELFDRVPEVRGMFEDPGSKFWLRLQTAHDVEHPDVFQMFMKELVELV